MAKSSLMINLDDPRAEKVAEVLSNKTCKKILVALAENEMTESEIASTLNLPLNTIGYNIKKLSDSGLIEKENKFLWSVKGKRVFKYRVSNKRIVISPKIGVKGIIPTLIVTLLAAAGIKIWSDSLFASHTIRSSEIIGATEKVATIASSTQEKSANIASQLANVPDIWAWYLLGALTVLLVIIILNWRRS